MVSNHVTPWSKLLLKLNSRSGSHDIRLVSFSPVVANLLFANSWRFAKFSRGFAEINSNGILFSLLAKNESRLIKSPVSLSPYVCVPLITFEPLGRFSRYLVGR
jgi:hypothetical protein